MSLFFSTPEAKTDTGDERISIGYIPICVGRYPTDKQLSPLLENIASFQLKFTGVANPDSFSRRILTISRKDPNQLIITPQTKNNLITVYSQQDGVWREMPDIKGLWELNPTDAGIIIRVTGSTGKESFLLQTAARKDNQLVSFRVDYNQPPPTENP